jgi:tetratricopeptide (TPR) repeat protein
MLYARGMRKVLAAVSATLAFVAVATAADVAHAQDDPPRSTRNYKAQPLNLRKEQLGTAAYTSAGRARMRAGDCAGALTSFDAALETSNQDPTLHRDRGLCHEKLGDVYPAIDDYRAYLTDSPDAPDAAGIRDRLGRLEAETSGPSVTPNKNDDTDVPPVMADASASVTVGGAPATASATSRERLPYVDRDDDPLDAPLRRGKGFTLAPFFAEHKWFFSGSAFGDSQTWSESVGAQLRYSGGAVAALAIEVGYEHFNSSTSASPFVLAGLTSLAALELRFPLDAAYDNQFLLAPGLGYEHIGYSPTNPESPSFAVNGLVPRVRFGYRHLIEDAAAFDFSIDVGVAKWFVPSDVGSPDIPATALVAANVALVWGL